MFFFFLKLVNAVNFTCKEILLFPRSEGSIGVPYWSQKQSAEVFYERPALKNLIIFTGKHMW